MTREFVPDIGWRNQRTIAGSDPGIPAAIDCMMNASDHDEATAAYWQIDNRALVQGQLFEAAEYVAGEVARRVGAGEYSAEGLPRALDLLVEIAYGEAHYTEVERGESDLGDRCRAQIRPRLDGIKSLVGPGSNGSSKWVVLGVLDLFDVLESDPRKRRDFLDSLSTAGWPQSAVERLRELRQQGLPLT